MGNTPSPRPGYLQGTYDLSCIKDRACMESHGAIYDKNGRIANLDPEANWGKNTGLGQIYTAVTENAIPIAKAIPSPIPGAVFDKAAEAGKKMGGSCGKCGFFLKPSQVKRLRQGRHGGITKKAKPAFRRKT